MLSYHLVHSIQCGVKIIISEKCPSKLPKYLILPVCHRDINTIFPNYVEYTRKCMR